jgi:hypothetical protein
MPVRRGVLDAAVVAIAIAGLGHAEHTFSSAGNRLIVSGSQKGVERFAKLQAVSRPDLVNLTSKSLGGGRSQAQMSLPATYQETDVIKITREALAAGLSYKLVAHRRSVTVHM